MNTVKKAKLYKMDFTAHYNKNLSPRTEYVRSELCYKKLLKHAKKWCKMPGTEYYGYVNVEIREQHDVPEIKSITIHIPRSKKK